jgi:hypothetical protein
MSKLYFAYGSNLNKAKMMVRCPTAKPLGRFQLLDWRLVFRGVADVVKDEGARVNGAIWIIEDADEAALDRYEGFDADHPDSGMYRKVTIDLGGLYAGHSKLMFYTMNSTGIFPPSHGYLATIREGYRDFSLSEGPLNKAVEASHDDKAPSHVERNRHRRNGRPDLAARPSKKIANKVRHQKAGSKPKPGPKPPKAKVRPPSPDKEIPQLDLDLFRRAMTVYGD